MEKLSPGARRATPTGRRSRFAIVLLSAAMLAAAPPPRADRHTIAELGGPLDGAHLTFSPDGKWLLATAHDEEGKSRSVVAKWDVRSRKIVARFPIQRGTRVSSLAISPSGKTFATCNSAGKVFVCDSSTGKVRLSYNQCENNGGAVSLLDFVDEDHVFSVDENGIGSKRNTRNERTAIYRIGDLTKLDAITLSPRGGLLAFINVSKSKLYVRGKDLETNILASFDLDLGGYSGRPLAITDDGAFALTSDSSTGLVLYDLKRDELVLGWEGHDRKKPVKKGGSLVFMIHDPKTKKIVEMRLLRDGEEVADDEKVRVVNPQTGNALVLKRIPASERVEEIVNVVVQIAAIPGRNVFVTSDRLGFIRFWNAKGDKLAEVRRHPRSVYTLAVSPDGKTLATGGADQPIVLWDLEMILKAKGGAK